MIDVAGLKPETPLFFTYHFQGKAVNFFVVKVRNKFLSFLDACASCYPHKRGYQCDNNYIFCRECGVKFSIHQLEKGLGSCYPLLLEGKMVEGVYVIPVAALEKASSKF